MGRVLAVIIWIVTLLSVLLFLSGKWWLPAAISNHAPALDRQFLITIIVVGISFTAAQIGLGWMVWKYRDTGKAGDRAIYSHGSNRLEVLWTVITAVVFIALGVMGQSVWASLRLNDAPPGSYSVEVVAQQFQWNFHYAGKDGKFGRSDAQLISGDNPLGLDPEDAAGKDDITSVNQFHVPVHTPVVVEVTSKDVIHSFNIPVLRVKQDTIPGQRIPIWFEATRTGHFELACAQLCGLGHYRMRADVLIDSPEDYAKWQADNAPPPQEEPAAAAPDNQPAPEKK
jgi:cytochrome c oxidase subunit 2